MQATYLNDHLAGALGGLTLLDHIESQFSDSHAGRLAAELRAEVEDDRQKLETVLADLGVSRSAPRQAAAWLSEKLAQLKLRLDDPRSGPLHRLEALEAMSLGIEGKRLLWVSLLAAADPRITVDLEALERRAADQRQRVEVLRREAAREVFAAE